MTLRRVAESGLLTACLIPAACRETCAARTVGFDVDKVAQSVGAYIVVALEGEPERIDPLVVDHLDFGTSLTDDDFNVAPLSANIGTLPSDEQDVWVTLAVDAAVKADWNAGRGRSQFRMHFAKEGDDAPAYGSIYFRGPDNKDAPTLTIKYRRP